ncbi:hypothetical protein SAMN04487939_10276 [Lysobacter sp. yr284]|uniref:hypothetical protein n=1 Tax=Lysobacter TaxID=68 RepID=UPI000898D60F|nr:hypothetical protein [Lysobacter sp. yr284]SDY42313.1 hypothetical protein SAMN04487939_10276 [Lysobacter sp. yr284]
MSGLTEPLLALLADAPQGLSLPRVCKRLGVRMSVLLRELAWIGEDAIGDAPGPGWVRVEARGETQVAVLTEPGRARLASHSTSP